MVSATSTNFHKTLYVISYTLVIKPERFNTVNTQALRRHDPELLSSTSYPLNA